MWRMNCERLMEYDGTIATMEEENGRLKARIAELEAPPHPITEAPPVTAVESHVSHHGSVGFHRGPQVSLERDQALGAGTMSHASVERDPALGVRPAFHATTGLRPTSPVGGTARKTGQLNESVHGRHGKQPIVDSARPSSVSGGGLYCDPDCGGPQPHRGKAPPVDSFVGESPDILFDDWYPALQRAAEWNGWSRSETLIQLAGHLRGRALQEWGLLSASDKSMLEHAVTAMRNRLDPSSQPGSCGSGLPSCNAATGRTCCRLH